MNRIIYSLIFILALIFKLSAQEADILLTIGNEQVDKAEFEYIYKKNNNNLFDATDKKSPEEYLSIFIDFKLKVVEAESLQMDTSKAFINELAGYRTQVAAPYLTDITYNEKLVQEMYSRMQQEVNASHILLRLPKNALPKQQKEVLKKITAIRQEIMDGKDFAQAAAEYSEDPSAKNNKGNLGYFSAFMMVAPFEDAAYNTPVGEISEPVKTTFGYHLIKVHNIRENKGELQVAHIMKNIPRNATPEDKAQAKAEIDRVYRELKQGADFAELAKKESQDRRSAVQGGELPWISAGRVVAEFSNAAFALKNTGDISAPVETKFGFHIIKKLNARSVPPFEEAQNEIESKIKKDQARNDSGQKVFIEKLKNEYRFKENKKGKNTLTDKKIQDASKLPEAILFTIDNKEYTTKHLASYLQKKQIKKGNCLSFYKRWMNDEIIALEDAKLEEKYPEFRYLMNEYHDGILLFNISQEKIWEFASKDSVGLQNFYVKNQKHHLWKERFKGSVITCKNKETREKAEEMFGTGMTIEEVAEHLNADREVITFETGAWEEGSNHIIDYYVWNGKTPEGFESQVTFIRGDKIAPEPKKLEEARGLYISEYQNHLEKNWLKTLRKKYKVKINKKLLKTIESV